jgi:hypothetical protein
MSFSAACITIIDTIIDNYTQLYTIIHTNYTNDAYYYDTGELFGSVVRAPAEAVKTRYVSQ